MGICYYCGKENDLPHRCSYCNLTFCDEHHLPENHGCINAPKRTWDDYKKIKYARDSEFDKKKNHLVSFRKRLSRRFRK